MPVQCEEHFLDYRVLESRHGVLEHIKQRTLSQHPFASFEVCEDMHRDGIRIICKWYEDYLLTHDRVTIPHVRDSYSLKPIKKTVRWMLRKETDEWLKGARDDYTI